MELGSPTEFAKFVVLAISTTIQRATSNAAIGERVEAAKGSVMKALGAQIVSVKVVDMAITLQQIQMNRVSHGRSVYQVKEWIHCPQETKCRT